ncbi:protein of unknown function (DUF4342) [Hoeflea sp. IMCC20628]|uniref:DUF4342 domain-containing protein n=1 Tax=Hoeflea sp. IMCC20628 TaxID=1620421 RepID=UPI00063BD36D|nr:DUF4342 domain-containing protein [Hoeflea sp. IMCC20628]AKH99342.1 protein of unknown function (DUF4342) [Hoeflea sp. IMCC20628]
MNDQDGKARKTFTEEIEVMGSQLIEQVKDLLKQGNVRQLRIKTSDGDIVLETPLTFGVVAGGAVALAAPWLAILGAIAAFVTKVKVEVVREVDEADDNLAQSQPDAPDVEPAPKPKATSRKAAAPKKTAAKAKATGKAKSSPKTKPAGKAKP